MADPVTWGYIIAAIGAGTAADASKQQKKASSKARKTRANLTARERLSEKRQQIRQERVQRARILNQAASEGVTGSSGVEGAIGGLRTQFGVGLGTIAQKGKAQKELNRSSSMMESAGVQSAIGGSMMSIGSSIFSMGGSTTPTNTADLPKADLN